MGLYYFEFEFNSDMGAQDWEYGPESNDMKVYDTVKLNGDWRWESVCLLTETQYCTSMRCDSSRCVRET